MTTKLKLSRLSDDAMLSMADEIAKAFPPSQMSIRVGSMNTEFTNSLGFRATYPNRDWLQSHVVQQVQVNLRGRLAWVDISRPSSPWEVDVEIRRNDGSQQGRMSDHELAAVHLLVDDLVTKYAPISVDHTASPELRDAVTREVSKLAELHRKIVKEANDFRLTDERERRSAKEKADQEYDARRLALEEEGQKRAEAYETERQKLVEKEKALDDRGHMHVRRELRGQITKDLKERLERPQVSSQAAFLRISVSGLSLAAITALSVYATYAAIDLHDVMINATTKTNPSMPVSVEAPIKTITEPVLFLAAGRFLFAAAAAAGLLFYLLGWLRRLHSEDVRNERELERYRYDIDRASWVVETILEARATEGEVPKEWVEGVTHNLFARNEQRDSEQNALEAVAALLGISAKAELGPEGTKLELKRDGLRRLKKAAEGE